MSWLHPRTLFGRTLATIAMVSIGFQLFVLLLFFYFLLLPLGQRSAEDLAQLMINTARMWQQHAVSEPELRSKIEREYGLSIGDREAPYGESSSVLPYRYFLERALGRLLHRQTVLKSSIDPSGKEWFWADIPIDGGVVRVGFERDRIGVQPPAAILLFLMVGIQVMLITSVVLARRLSAPMERLASAARRMGRGEWPDPVPEEGPEEMAELARSFNRMTTQVRELLANRTTLLAGISHDLRTPLTQIQLALAMLPNEGGSPELMAGIRRDMDRIDSLIGQFLEISRGLEGSRRQDVVVDDLIGEVVDQFHSQGEPVSWTPCCDRRLRLHRLSLLRVLVNLTENALRYGGEGVEIHCHCPEQGDVTIEVLDRGPGIPPEQRNAVFRPFFRLEGSRSRASGGSGLGLAVVKQLCDANGWGIEIGDREGGGTRITVTIGRGAGSRG